MGDASVEWRRGLRGMAIAVSIDALSGEAGAVRREGELERPLLLYEDG
jgi:hypothetical protein